MNVIIKRIKKIRYLNYYILFFLLYVFNLRNIIFPKYFQQDDLAELRVTSIIDFVCVVNQGANHPFLTYLIWITNKFFGFNTPYIISFLNICLSFCSVILIFKILSKYINKFAGMFASTIIISSNSFLTYSVSLKQYSFEIFSISLLIYLISEHKLSIKHLLNNKKYLGYLFLLSGFSLTIPVFMFLSIFFVLIKDKRDNLKLTNLVFIFFPILIFGNQILDKITLDSYGSYWNNFFIKTSSFPDFFSSTKFLISLLLKNIFSSFYHESLFILFIFFLIVPIFLKKSNIVNFSYFILFIFIFLNVFRIYPIGGGRTDIVFIPFVLIIFSFSIFQIFKKYYMKIFITLFIVFLSILNTNAFYKIENLYSPLVEIEADFNNSETLNVILYDQRHSFDYEAKKIFGTKEVLLNECRYLQPNVDNYLILGKPTNKQKNIINLNEIILNSNLKTINLIGIELNGTTGEFRDYEKIITSLNYKTESVNIYQTGIYLIKFRK